MKTMKNVLMILLGAALVLSLAGVGAVAAAGETITKETAPTGQITVSYTIGESYSVTIPADVTLSEAGATDATFSVDSATLGTGSTLVVKVTSTYGWNMKLDDENMIPYTMKYDDDGDGEVTEVTVGEDGDVTIYTTDISVTQKISKTLSFVMNDADDLPTKAGTYTDTLTFTVTHTEATGNNPTQ